MTTTSQDMAEALRAALAEDGIDLPPARADEIVARQLTGRHGEIGFPRCSPIFRMFDEAKAREFYCGFLGFEVRFEHRFAPGLPLYIGMERGGFELHLSEHHGDATPGSTAFVETLNIRAYHRELIAKGYAYNRPGLEELPWGLQVEVSDPFGNRIRFCERI